MSDNNMGLTGLVGWIVVLLLAIGANVWFYSCTRDDCEERGGHVEVVYGKNNGWTCSGATR